MSFVDVDFFARDTLEVARDLVGATMVMGACAARIVETEAYTTDAASHWVTRRHKAAMMRETFGHIYVYRIYGLHYCLNFTTEREGVGAVLIRAAEPTRGIAQMVRRRGLTVTTKLLSGPARLCQAFGIDAQLNGLPVGGRIKLQPREVLPEIDCGPRIGISRAAELPWRFFERDSPYVSGKKGRAGDIV